MKLKALRAGDAHSHEDEESRKRLRSARECAKAHSFVCNMQPMLQKEAHSFMDNKVFL